jgi:beta-glucanase (GH16 family)
MNPLKKTHLPCLFGTLLLLSGTLADSQEATPAQTPAAPASPAPAPGIQDATASPTPYGDAVQGYKLTWSDEFNGGSLDTDKWVCRTDSKMWSTQLPQNISVSNGCLNIALKKEKAQGKSYTGGGIISRQAFEYGYYEASFKIPPGSGWHTSFWFAPSNGKGNAAKKVVLEIDFCEQDSVGQKAYSAGVISWDQRGKGYGREYVHTPNLHDGFHVWGCEFTPEAVKFFFDGRLTHQTDATKFHPGMGSIWLTCIASQLGSTWGVDGKKLPAVAQFDYVRFYTKQAP